MCKEISIDIALNDYINDCNLNSKKLESYILFKFINELKSRNLYFISQINIDSLLDIRYNSKLFHKFYEQYKFLSFLNIKYGLNKLTVESCHNKHIYELVDVDLNKLNYDTSYDLEKSGYDLFNLIDNIKEVNKNLNFAVDNTELICTAFSIFLEKNKLNFNIDLAERWCELAIKNKKCIIHNKRSLRIANSIFLSLEITRESILEYGKGENKYKRVYNIDNSTYNIINEFSKFIKQYRSQVDSAIWYALSIFSNFLLDRNINSYDLLTSKIINDFFNEYKNTDNIKYQSTFYTTIIMFILWLASNGKINIMILLECDEFHETINTLYFKEEIKFIDSKVLANDLLDIFICSKYTYTDIPSWSKDIADKFSEYYCNSYKFESNIRGLKLVSIISRWFSRRNIIDYEYVLPSLWIKLIDFISSINLTIKMYKPMINVFIRWLYNNSKINKTIFFLTENINIDKFKILNNYDFSTICCDLDYGYDFNIITNSISNLVKIMHDLGYKSTPIKESLSFIRNLCIFLHERNFKFTYKFGEICCKVISDTSGKKIATGCEVGLFIIDKIINNKDINSDILISEFYFPRRSSELKFSDWCNDLIISYLNMKRDDKLSQSTLSMYIAAIKRFINFVESRGINDFKLLTPNLIKEFNQNDIHSTPQGKAAYNFKIRMFLVYLADNNVISYLIPMALTINSAKKVNIVKILTNEQINCIIEFCNNHLNDKKSKIGLAFKLALQMGLRASDILNIRLDSINISKNSLRFIQKKTKKEIELPIPNSILRSIYAYLNGRRKFFKNDQLILSHKAPVHKLKKMEIKGVFDELNCEKFTMHQLRKTFASVMLSEGVDFTLIAHQLGHSDFSNLDVYLAAPDDMLRELCLDFSGFEFNPMEDFGLLEI